MEILILKSGECQSTEHSTVQQQSTRAPLDDDDDDLSARQTE